MLLSENTFAGHWETVEDCMENSGGGSGLGWFATKRDL